MALDVFITFVLASTILTLTPGPNISLIVANSLKDGVSGRVPTIIGICIAQAILLTIVVSGMTSLIAAMTDWIEWIRWIGAVYLIYIGVQMIRAKQEHLEAENGQARNGRTAAKAFLIAITNPKVMLFYVAFFPQFLDPAGDTTTQLIIMSLAAFSIGLIIDIMFAAFSVRARHYLLEPRRALMRLKITGGFMIAAGVGLALARRS